MKKRKWSKVGWMGKGENWGVWWDCAHFNPSLNLDEINKIKGCQDDWDDFNWPPRKVRVTVEEI